MKNVKLVNENLPDGTILRLERGEAECDVEWYDVVQPVVGKKAHPSTEIRIGSESRKIADNHVAVYPERLVNYFIQGSTNEGHIVLDPFMGTGTTAVVAHALGRHYIGFDISEKYVQFARERVESGPYLEELKDKTDANTQKTWDDYKQTGE
jgi:DNA modification methylase